jgi:hypothetical protein
MSHTNTSTSKIEVNYRKIRPLDLDELAKQYNATEDDINNQYNPFLVSEIQSFSPLYTDFFVLNESNYNRVGLNHRYYLDGSSICGGGESQISKYHVKCSPLLDPVHYLVGKYKNAFSLRNSACARAHVVAGTEVVSQENHRTPTSPVETPVFFPTNLRLLPNLTNQSECFPKIVNKQNASYVDGFFSYLSSQLKHKHNMLNAVDFYGSYLAIQKVFKATITDDIEYLNQSSYFLENIGKGFTISCGKTFDDFTGIGSRANKRRLVLEEELDSSELGIDDALEWQSGYAFRSSAGKSTRYPLGQSYFRR